MSGRKPWLRSVRHSIDDVGEDRLASFTGDEKGMAVGFLDRLKGVLPSKGEAKGTTSGSMAEGDWIADEEWRSWNAPLDIVSGESHYQSALQKVAGAPRHGGWVVACEAELLREPENRYDPDAIVVLIGGDKVGYISADACGEIAPAMDDFGGHARAKGIPALVRGGWTDMPSLGVLLWLNHEEVCASLPTVDWKGLIDEFTCRHWPPSNLAGASSSGAGTSTGQERSGAAGGGFTGEPRLPPLTEHYSAYVEDVKVLKRRKDNVRAEVLLLALIEAVEEESRTQGLGVAPWYYEQLRSSGGRSAIGMARSLSWNGTRPCQRRLGQAVARSSRASRTLGHASGELPSPAGGPRGDHTEEGHLDRDGDGIACEASQGTSAHGSARSAAGPILRRPA